MISETPQRDNSSSPVAFPDGVLHIPQWRRRTWRTAEGDDIEAVIDIRMDALAWMRKKLKGDEKDLLREMVRLVAEGLMWAKEDRCCDHRPTDR